MSFAHKKWPEFNGEQAKSIDARSLISLSKYFFLKSKLGSFSPALLESLCFIKSKPQQQQNTFLENDSLPFDAALADCVYRLAVRLKILSLAQVFLGSSSAGNSSVFLFLECLV